MPMSRRHRGPIRSIRREPDAKPPRSYLPGRACLVCGTRLTRYNPASYCYSHQPSRFGAA
jgi:hypothetical protein